MSQHNHANGFNTVGLGEFAAVINGVSFRTRHNDYSLKMPHQNTMDYHATQDIPRPPVPKDQGCPKKQPFKTSHTSKSYLTRAGVLYFGHFLGDPRET